ncbi:MAG TPA: hypothetical protein VI893_03725, partial [Thermoplasmata archaeon]|nr:hypothetical protein [Thermoplasmata archaeon]
MADEETPGGPAPGDADEEDVFEIAKKMVESERRKFQKRFDAEKARLEGRAKALDVELAKVAAEAKAREHELHQDMEQQKAQLRQALENLRERLAETEKGAAAREQALASD